jgi:type I restriction enzyme R subunit
MSTPTEHKTVQARILAYAEAIGWTFVSQKEAEKRRGIGDSKLEIGKGSLFFEDLLDANPSSPIGYAGARVREFNPRYAEAEGALPGKFRHLHTDIYGNREFVEHLRNRGKFFDHEEKRERDLPPDHKQTKMALNPFTNHDLIQ